MNEVLSIRPSVMVTIPKAEYEKLQAKAAVIRLELPKLREQIQQLEIDKSRLLGTIEMLCDKIIFDGANDQAVNEIRAMMEILRVMNARKR